MNHSFIADMSEVISDDNNWTATLVMREGRFCIEVVSKSECIGVDIDLSDLLAWLMAQQPEIMVAFAEELLLRGNKFSDNKL